MGISALLHTAAKPLKRVPQPARKIRPIANGTPFAIRATLLRLTGGVSCRDVISRQVPILRCFHASYGHPFGTKMIRCSLILFASLLLHCSAPTPSGLNGTRFQLWQQGTGPFHLTDHYISNETGIVLSLYSAPEELANFAPNFRGLLPKELPFDPARFEAWRVEYFCQPDYVLGEYDAQNKALAYFGKLRWIRSLWLDPKTGTLKLTYRHRPGYGLIHEGVDDAYRNDAGPIEAELAISFTWKQNENRVLVTLEIHNASSKIKDYTFAAQDAAYLWFPNQKQQNLEGFLFRSGDQADQPFWIGEGLPRHFAGTYSKTHGIVSGFQSVYARKPDNVTLKSAAGTSGFYLLVPPSVPVGYQIPLQDKGHDFENLIRIIQAQESQLLNRYLAFNFQGVTPGQTCSVSFNLVMGNIDPNGDIAGQLSALAANP